MNIKLNIIACLVASLIAVNSLAQRVNDLFGQNRIQYDLIDWNFKDTTHFRIFYDGKNSSLAEIALNTAEQEAEVMAEVLKSYIDFKSTIVIYSSYNKYIQSNINSNTDYLVINSLGKIKLAGEVFPIYYDGNVSLLKKQIREAIARGSIEKILFGNNIKNLGKSIIDNELPFWFREGYIQYLVDSTTDLDILNLETYFSKNKKIKFNKMAFTNPSIAGEFFWHYIFQNYGEKLAVRILKKGAGLKSFHGAVESITKKKWKKIEKEWLEFCTNLIENYNNANPIEDTQKPYSTLEIKDLNSTWDFRASQMYSDFSYSTYDKSRWYSKIASKNNIQNVLLEGPEQGYFQDKDVSNPITAWSPNGNKMVLVYKFKSGYRIKIYNALKRTMATIKIKNKVFDRILSINFTESNNNFLVSAVKNGKSDIFVYNISTGRAINITRDDYNDLQPMMFYSKNKKGIVFLSNREELTTEIKGVHRGSITSPAFNLYFLNFVNRDNTLVKLTDFKDGLITNICQFGDRAISFVMDSNNVRKRLVVEFIVRDFQMDSLHQYELPSSEYLVAQQYIPHDKSVAEFTYKNGQIKAYKRPVEIALLDTLYTPLIEELKAKSNVKKIDSMDINMEKQYGNFFNSEYFNESSFGNILDYALNDVHENEKTIKRIKPDGKYTNFKLDDASFALNNDLLFNRFQFIKNTNGQGFINPTLDGMYKFSTTDIMGDYNLTIGYKTNLNLSGLGSDVMVRFLNKKQLVDWSILGYRKRQTLMDNSKLNVDYIEGLASYAFNPLNKIICTIGFRANNNKVPLINSNQINITSNKSNWLYSHLEYVYDKSYSPTLNIWKGLKFKLYMDYFKGFKENKSHIFNFGIDLRNYITIHKDIIWASRISGACSYGNAKILYYLGGVENEISSEEPFKTNNTLFNNNVYVTPQNYMYQTMVGNLRGFDQNYNNGNGYLLFNTEVRVPIVSSLSSKPINSAFLRNLQLLMFLDAGSTWIGNMPSSDNYQRKLSVSGNPISYIVDLKTGDIPAGFGLGIRTKLWGSFIKFDVAYDANNINWINPINHVSLGFDF